MKKLLMLGTACAIVVLTPACRRKKTVELPAEEITIEMDQEIVTIEKRVSGPNGWNLTAEDLK